MIEALLDFFQLYTVDADYLPDFWITMILLYLNAGLYLNDLYNLVKRKSKAETFSLMAIPGVFAEHSFTGQTPEPAYNGNTAPNESCAASYCISLSDSMGNRALTTKEA